MSDDDQPKTTSDENPSQPPHKEDKKLSKAHLEEVKVGDNVQRVHGNHVA